MALVAQVGTGTFNRSGGPPSARLFGQRTSASTCRPPPPPPPPGQCADGQDNDRDGLTDIADVAGCTSPQDGDERDPVLRLSHSRARSLARDALEVAFGWYFTGRYRVWRFQRWDSSPSMSTFSVGWSWPRNLAAKRWRRYRGRVTVRQTAVDTFRWSLRIGRTLYPSERKLVVERSGNLCL
jgi:hypothetical protein